MRAVAKRFPRAATVRRVALVILLTLFLLGWVLSYWRHFGAQALYGLYSANVACSRGCVRADVGKFTYPGVPSAPLMFRTEWYGNPQGFVVGDTFLHRMGFYADVFQLSSFATVAVPFWCVLAVGVVIHVAARRRRTAVVERGFQVAVPGVSADEPGTVERDVTADEQRSVPWYERRTFRRIALVVIAVLLLAVSIRAAGRIPVLRAQRAWLAGAPPANAVVYEDHPDRAAALLVGDVTNYRPVPCAPGSGPLIAAGRVLPMAFGAVAREPGVLMLRERLNALEETVIVLVTVDTVEVTPRGDRTLRCAAKLIRPASLAGGPQVLHTEPFTITATAGETVTIMSAASDVQEDAYHFKISLTKAKAAWRISGQVLGDRLIVSVEPAGGRATYGAW